MDKSSFSADDSVRYYSSRCGHGLLAFSQFGDPPSCRGWHPVLVELIKRKENVIARRHWVVNCFRGRYVV